MEVLHLSEVDSTSTYGAELLAAGKKPPFLVCADRQTKGRGRRGHSWESPEGNLYATLVLPSEPAQAGLQGLMSLKAGIVIAGLLQDLTGLRLTLKWPNDILFGGLKLGGLLLESSLNGQQLGPLLIGIGLNVASAPHLPGVYQAICLKQLLGRDLQITALVSHLAAGFFAAWQRLPLAAVPEAYPAYGILPGHMYSNDQGDLAEYLGLGDDGTLRLRLQDDGTTVALSSADHGWRWLHQGAAASTLLLADIGNSAIKLARVDGDGRQQLERWSYGEPQDELLAALQRLRPQQKNWPLFITSVRPQATIELNQAAVAVGLRPVALTKRPVRRWGKGYALGELGLDRLAGIEAWLGGLSEAERTVARGFGVIVQAGTATTIDVVRTTGEHLGGLILPGLTLALSSLHQAAALLPEIDAAATRAASGTLGHDTRSAMLNAATTMTVGCVERVVAAVSREHALDLLPQGIAISGGWAELLAPAIGARVVADLVVNGAGIIARGG